MYRFRVYESFFHAVVTTARYNKSSGTDSEKKGEPKAALLLWGLKYLRVDLIYSIVVITLATFYWKIHELISRKT